MFQSHVCGSQLAAQQAEAAGRAGQATGRNTCAAKALVLASPVLKPYVLWPSPTARIAAPDHLSFPDTVVSVQAAPFYERAPEGADEAEWQKKELRKMRRNVKSAMLQLSMRGYRKYEGKIARIKLVRPALSGSWDEHGLNRASSALTEPAEYELAIDGSSNLFYYLFEDYEAAMPILRKSKRILDDLVSGSPTTMTSRQR